METYHSSRYKKVFLHKKFLWLTYLVQELVVSSAVGSSSLAKKNPNITLPLLGYTAAFTTVGVATGVGVAFYRKAPLHVYGIFSWCKLWCDILYLLWWDTNLYIVTNKQ